MLTVTTFFKEITSKVFGKTFILESTISVHVLCFIGDKVSVFYSRIDRRGVGLRLKVNEESAPSWHTTPHQLPVFSITFYGFQFNQNRGPKFTKVVTPESDFWDPLGMGPQDFHLPQ